MSAKSEYRKYLTWLQSQIVSDDARRVAHVVADTFDSTARTSANSSQRTRHLLPLLEQGIDAEIDPLEDGVTSAQPPRWTQLRSLTLGPFRGFRAPATFNLARSIVLVYGPNGTGKSSLCEALEYALLGSVADAAAKRIPEQEYLANVHAGRFDPPVLTATGSDGNEIPVSASLDSFRFCFIEKNRIDGFARMGARPPSQRMEAIAALFGMEDFVEFVRNFNADITQQLKITPVKGQQLERLRQALAADRTTVAGEPVECAALAIRKTAVALAVEEGLAYEALLTRIGSENTQGRLQQLQTELDAIPPSESGLDPDDLERLRQAAQDAADAHGTLARQLAQQGAKVNYKALYEAVQGLEPQGLDHCPACATPLSGPAAAKGNPFERARTGLQQLHELAALQDRQRAAAEKVGADERALSDGLRQIVDFPRTTPSAAMSMLGGVLSDSGGPLLSALDTAVPNVAENDSVVTLWEAARQEAQRAKDVDVATNAVLAKRAADIAERDRLRTAQTAAVEIALLERQMGEKIAAASARIEGFDVANAQLIAEANEEAARITLHDRIHRAYNAFLGSLQRYRDALPRALTADLSASALAFYNAFNRNDHDADRLAQIVLPVTDDERVMVAFNSHPKSLHDALHMMSEGHLRCLGLAILVAKNVQQACPVLIFDDPVNAIDDEHRLSIRDTLFENSLLQSKQVILLCHGEELIKDIEMFIGASRADKDCHSYTLLPHDGDRLIRVDHGGTRNYILKARECFSKGRLRDALGESRLATESICMRTWRFLAKFAHEELRLTLRRNRQPVESNDLAMQLRKQIAVNTFHHPSKAELVECFDQMLKRWAMLNPASHEEEGRTEFQRQEVKALIENLEVLDRLLAGKSRSLDKAAAEAAATIIAAAAVPPCSEGGANAENQDGG